MSSTAGVELGATSTSEEALEVPAGGAGSITITNNGTLSGAGGAAGGGAGGDAFEAAVACTLVNNGLIRAGGGGGGQGGTGGNGSYSTSNYTYNISYRYWYFSYSGGNKYFIRYNGTYVRGLLFLANILFSYIVEHLLSRTGSHQWNVMDSHLLERRYAYYRSTTNTKWRFWWCWWQRSRLCNLQTQVALVALVAALMLGQVALVVLAALTATQVAQELQVQAANYKWLCWFFWWCSWQIHSRH